MSPVSRGIDRLSVTFDEPGLVANAGLLLTSTLVQRLGLEDLIDAEQDTGPGPSAFSCAREAPENQTHRHEVLWVKILHKGHPYHGYARNEYEGQRLPAAATRPEALSSAINPASRASQPRYPSLTVDAAALEWTDHLYMATNAVEQCGPSAPCEGNETLWPIENNAAAAPESIVQSGAMNGPGCAMEGKSKVVPGE